MNRGCAAALFLAAAVLFSGCSPVPSADGKAESGSLASPSGLPVFSGSFSESSRAPSSAKNLSSALRSAASSQAQASSSAAAGSSGTASPPSPAASAPAAKKGIYRAPPLALSPYHSSAAEGSGGAYIDASATDLGYVAAKATNSKRLKFQVIHGDTTYNYDLPGDGTPASFPLQTGSGSYTFRVMQNTSGSKYAQVYSADGSVSLRDSLQPFLRPSQLVDYGAGSACVRKAASLASGASDEVEAAANIYAYIRDNIRYDHQKAKSVASGYVPDPDETLETGKGICFDYASLAAAMLRSQGIPTKLMTGYVSPGNIYHAWNMIWLEETGWITVNIKIPAEEWDRIDLTFAAGGADTGGAGYTDRYTY